MAAVSQLLLCSWRCCSRVTDSWTVLDRQQKTMMIYGSDAEVGNPMDDIFHGNLRW